MTSADERDEHDHRADDRDRAAEARDKDAAGRDLRAAVRDALAEGESEMAVDARAESANDRWSAEENRTGSLLVEVCLPCEPLARVLYNDVDTDDAWRVELRRDDVSSVLMVSSADPSRRRARPRPCDLWAPGRRTTSSTIREAGDDKTAAASRVRYAQRLPTETSQATPGGRRPR